MMNKNTSTKRIVSLVLAIAVFAAMFALGAYADNNKIYVNGKLVQNGEVVTAENGSVIVKIDPVATDDVVTVNGKVVKLDENGEFVLYTATPDAAETADAPVATDDTPDTPDTPDEPVVALGDVTIVVTDKDGNKVSVSFTLEDAEETTDTADVVDTDDEVETVDTPDDVETTDTPDEPKDTEDTPDEPKDTEDTPDVPPVDTDDTPDEPEDTEDTPDEPKDTEDTPDVPPVDTDDTPDEPKTEKYLNGDVDFDGLLTSNDAVLILRFSVGVENFSDVQKVVGDVNGDKANYSDDALAVLRASVGLETITPEYVDVVVG